MLMVFSLYIALRIRKVILNSHELILSKSNKTLPKLLSLIYFVNQGEGDVQRSEVKTSVSDNKCSTDDFSIDMTQNRNKNITVIITYISDKQYIPSDSYIEMVWK